jgi:hypothetical protein
MMGLRGDREGGPRTREERSPLFAHRKYSPVRVESATVL